MELEFFSAPASLWLRVKKNQLNLTEIEIWAELALYTNLIQRQNPYANSGKIYSNSSYFFFKYFTKIIQIPTLKTCSGILKSNQIIMLFVRGQLCTQNGQYRPNIEALLKWNYVLSAIQHRPHLACT